MPLGRGETIAKKVDATKKDASEKVDINLYFGIFFDGTGANKFQMMLGKKFRRDELFKKFKEHKKSDQPPYTITVKDKDGNTIKDKDGKDKIIEINNGHDFLKLTREELEKEKIFTVSELDQLFFDHDTEGRIEKRIIENCSADDDNKSSKGIASMPNDAYTTEILKKVATEVADERQEDSSDYASSLKDTPAENFTYTNVAILESCYQYKKEKNDYYIPIYVEGSGSDMQFAKKISVHTFGHILEGFAKATGYAGVTAKVTKMVKMINREIKKKAVNDTKIKIVFDVFGFSRGSTEARIFNYIATDSCESPKKLKELCGHKKPFDNNAIKTKKVRFLGIFDTVSSIGAIRNINLLLFLGIGNIIPSFGKSIEYKNLLRQINNNIIDNDVKTAISSIQRLSGVCSSIKSDIFTSLILELSKIVINGLEYHDQNVYDYGLYATNKAESVFHICAMDEFRRNFALVDIQSSINSNGLELFIPGCHGDIGGAPDIERSTKKQIDKYTKDEPLFNGGPNIKPNIPTWWPSAKLFSQDTLYYQSNFEGLQKIGLINSNETKSGLSDSIKKKKYVKDILRYIETSLTTESDDFIEFYPYVKPGYSNVALHLMFDRTKEKIEKNHYPFTTDLPPCYKVTDELDKYYNDIKKKVIKKETTGRFFVDPDQETYRWLRQNYLHFTANCVVINPENPPDCYTTNGPSYFEDTYDSSKENNDGSLFYITDASTPKEKKKPVLKPAPELQIIATPSYSLTSVKKSGGFVSRIIYSGEKLTRPSRFGDNDWKFMCDYNPADSNVISLDKLINTSTNIKPVIRIDIIDDEIKKLESEIKDKQNEIEKMQLEMDELTSELIKNIENKGKARSINSKIVPLRIELNRKNAEKEKLIKQLNHKKELQQIITTL